MKTCKELEMHTFKEMYVRTFKSWPDYMGDFIFGLTLIFSPIYMPIVWSIAYVYRQFKLRNV